MQVQTKSVVGSSKKAGTIPKDKAGDIPKDKAVAIPKVKAFTIPKKKAEAVTSSEEIAGKGKADPSPKVKAGTKGICDNNTGVTRLISHELGHLRCANYKFMPIFHQRIECILTFFLILTFFFNI